MVSSKAGYIGMYTYNMIFCILGPLKRKRYLMLIDDGKSEICWRRRWSAVDRQFGENGQVLFFECGNLRVTEDDSKEEKSGRDKDN